MTSAATLLREARRRAGLTPVAPARRAGVTQSVVSAYASGAGGRLCLRSSGWSGRPASSWTSACAVRGHGSGG
jgi:predicted transcriptional regulator